SKAESRPRGAERPEASRSRCDPRTDALGDVRARRRSVRRAERLMARAARAAHGLDTPLDGVGVAHLGGLEKLGGRGAEGRDTLVEAGPVLPYRRERPGARGRSV